MSPRPLENRTAIVFGAGFRGDGWSNGKAAAVAYARAGARVACIDIDEGAAAETAAVIAAEGGSAIHVQCDVVKLSSVELAVEAVLAQFGSIDILHNNVGVTHMGGPVELDEATFRLSMELNFGSVYRTAKVVLPYMIERNSGVVINISSLAAIRWTGYPYFAYMAAKAAVNQATVAIAIQYGRNGIRANCVVPGAIDTPLIYRQIASQYDSLEQMVEARNRSVPMGHMGDAWDVANASVFLASDQAKFITGVCLPVDGGHSCAIPFATTAT
jgi:NAD(P)-dependent dehydrogenase (short-subunit alcohol dehydrogenase family)